MREKRGRVPDYMVQWAMSYPEYAPVEFTADVVLQQPPWADPKDASKVSTASPAAVVFVHVARR